MFEKFLEYVKNVKSPNTYEAYKNALAPFETGDYDEVMRFIAGNRTARDKKYKLSVLNTALKWNGTADSRISRAIRDLTVNKEIEPCPTDSEVERIWKNLDTPRNRLLFALMAYNGLRIGEVYNLAMSDVLPGNRLLLRGTKGKRDAVIPIVHPRVKENLTKYLQERDSEYPALFIGRRGRLSLITMKIMVMTWCRDNGLPYHAHSFRRYFANSLDRAGCTLQEICVAMRHKSPTTTLNYLNLDGGRVEEALRKAVKV